MVFLRYVEEKNSLGSPKENSPPHWFKGNPTTLCLVREWESLPPSPLLFPDMFLHQFSFSRSRGGGGRGGHLYPTSFVPSENFGTIFFFSKVRGKYVRSAAHPMSSDSQFPDIGPTYNNSQTFLFDPISKLFCRESEEKRRIFLAMRRKPFIFSRLRSLGKKCQINNFPPPPFPPLFKTTLHSSMLSPPSLLPSLPLLPPCPLTSE